MSNISKSITTALVTIEKAGIKPPWKVMGCWSNPDFLPFMPSGTEYRKIAPGSQPVKVVVPHDDGNVFDIKYFTKDYRRNSMYTARQVDTKPFDFDKMFASYPLKPDELKEVPLPGMMPTRGH